MVRRIETVRVDDLDESLPADETMVFGFDGRVWEIDLAAQHAEAFREVLKRHAKSGRRSGRTTFGRK